MLPFTQEQRAPHFKTEGRTLTAGLGLTRGEAQQGLALDFASDDLRGDIYGTSTMQ